MRKIILTSLAGVGVAALYVIAYYFSTRLGLTDQDMVKMLPVSAAAFLGNLIALFTALNTAIAEKPKLHVECHSTNDWTIVLRTVIDCRRSPGVLLEGISSPFLLFSVAESAATSRAETTLGAVEATEIKEFLHNFEVLPGDRITIGRQRSLKVSCVYREVDARKPTRSSFSLPNPFHRS